MGSDGLGALLATVTAALADGADPDPEALRTLATTTDVLAIGALADDARRARHGQSATFARVYELDVAAAATWAPAPDGAGEVRLTGRPASLDDAVAAVAQAVQLAGGRVVRGFWLADLDRLGRGAMAAVRTAGLDEVAFAAAADADAVGRARRAGLGVRVVAVDEAPADRVRWLIDAQRLAAAVGGVTAVAPLPRRIDRRSPTTGFDDVRTVALARLLADVPSVQVDWARYGPKLAQVALSVGADDLDGVSAIDDPALGPRRAAAEDVRRNIVSAGLTAVERDGRWAASSR
jgi:aminodeoxyfutalosine synthase